MNPLGTVAAFAAGAGAAALTALLLRRLESRHLEASDACARVSARSTPVLAADGEAERFPVTHIEELFGVGEHFPSPLISRTWPRNLNFVPRGEEVLEGAYCSADGTRRAQTRSFLVAGPPEQLVWDPRTVRAAVVTCGGLCPGLNTVVREIVMCLHYVYAVPVIFGVPNGYRGFYGTAPWRELTPTVVRDIHREGGTMLGSSRGGFDLDKILDALAAKGVNMLFVVGGDGTHRGALELLKGATARRMRLSVAGVPKTIDNDIPLVEKSFGFDTAVQGAWGLSQFVPFLLLTPPPPRGRAPDRVRKR